MKSIILRYYVLILSLFLTTGMHCKAEKDSLMAVIDIVIHDSSLLKDAVLEFELYKDGISSRYIKDRQYVRAELVDSISRFAIPLSTKINYGRIVFTSGKLRESYSPVNLNYDNNLFLFEHGDSIQLHLYPKKIRDVAFTGNRASKYKALYEINNKKTLETDVNDQWNSLFDKNEIKKAFDVMQDWADSLNRELDRILNTLGSSLNTDIKEILLYDNSAYTYNVMRSKMDWLVRTKEDDANALHLVNSFLSKQIFGQQSLLNESAAALSFERCDLLLFIERLRSKVKHILVEGSTPLEESLGTALSERYTGQIRNKLYYLALLRNLDADRIIRTAIQNQINTTEADQYWKAAMEFVERSEGSPAFDFEMVDENGVAHRLSDYKGKVVIIDFWFSGCMACMYLTNEMREAVEYYKNSEDVIFVSLNFDRYSDFWRKSLVSGKYTHEFGLNLWAGDVGTKHPIIGHYEIQSYPTLLIVNKEGILVEKHINRLFIKNDPLATNKFKKIVNRYR